MYSPGEGSISRGGVRIIAFLRRLTIDSQIPCILSELSQPDTSQIVFPSQSPIDLGEIAKKFIGSFKVEQHPEVQPQIIRDQDHLPPFHAVDYQYKITMSTGVRSNLQTERIDVMIHSIHHATYEKERQNGMDADSAKEMATAKLPVFGGSVNQFIKFVKKM